MASGYFIYLYLFNNALNIFLLMGTIKGNIFAGNVLMQKQIVSTWMIDFSTKILFYYPCGHS